MALIVPNWKVVASLSCLEGSPAQLADDPRVRAVFAGLVNECNRDLASFETIKRFLLLERDFSESREELTPTLKPKRRVITRHFAAAIEKVYSAAS